MANSQDKANCPNGLSDDEHMLDTTKADLSNGFENRILDFDYHSRERNTNVFSYLTQAQDNKHGHSTEQSVQQHCPWQNAVYSTGRRLTTDNQLEEAHSSVDPLSQQLHQDKSSVDTLQCALPTSTQTGPLLQTQTQMNFVPEHNAESTHFSKIRGQFEVRSQMYPQQNQYSDRAGYVSAEKICKDFNTYRSDNPVFTAQGHYMTVRNHAELAPRSISPQPPYYTRVLVLAPTQRFVAAGRQPQYSYSSYPETVVSAYIKEQTIINPYSTHLDIYPSQHSANRQRFSQELPQNQTQPVTQSVAQNESQPTSLAVTTEKISHRGPKPMVPPRGNSKITYDLGYKKSTSNPAQVSQYIAIKTNFDQKTNILQDQLQQSDVTAVSSGLQLTTDDQDSQYVTSIIQKPRTRQDGLFVDSVGVNLMKDNAEATVSKNRFYVSKSENRKSIDVSTGIQKSNETSNFTFPSNSNQELNKLDRKTSSATDIKRAELNSAFTADQRKVDTASNLTPLEARQDIRKGSSTERKPDLISMSPNQRIVVSQENRRSDYLNECKTPPLNLDGNRVEDVRKSPMLFVPIRDTSLDRANQKSPSFQNQQFEKTRQDLSVWAEQRQRQKLERGIQQNQFLMTSPRPRNQLDERIEEKVMHQFNNRKDIRVSQLAFQPVADISQSAILEQRRHLRHVSADLTKHMELSNKEFDDQANSGSVTNLVPATNVAWVQRGNPNLANQYPAYSETKIDTKSALTIVTDFGDTIEKPVHQVDHIIHSHRRSHVLSSNFLTYSRSQTENLQNQGSSKPEMTDCSQQSQQKQLQNQQSLDFLSDKLKQCELQQNDLHAKLQCLQNQNQILDKVAQFQHRQSDLKLHIQSFPLQNQSSDNSQMHLPVPAIEENSDLASGKNEQHLEQYQHEKSSLNQDLFTTDYSPVSSLQTSVPYDKLSPRLQQEDPNPFSTEVSNFPFSSLPQFDMNHLSRRSFSQFNRMQDPVNKVATLQCPSVTVSSSNIHITGTLKKVPPEKPPRTSLIVQTPEVETLTQSPTESAEVKELVSTGTETYSTLNPGVVSGGNSNHHNIREDNNIDTEHALVYHDGNLVSGSLEALVQHMVPTEEYYPDRAYLFAFLLSARLFIKPHELLGEVCALCERQQNLNGENGKERLFRFVPRLVQLLAEWTGIFPYDFRDERMMSHVKSITQKIAAVDAAVRQEVSTFLQNLLLRLTALERYEEGLARLAKEATTEQLTQVDLTELCPSSTVLAQQLTHVELERLSYIGPEEFVQAFAKELPHLETSFKDMKKTRNLESYVQWFNRLSYFVATEVSKHVKKKQRVRVVEYWIETARECFNIGNFNSLMAIIAGLNMSPISRLKKTWSKVQSSKFSILEHQMDPSSNFSSYRSTLKAAMWRSAGATDEQQRIVIPFFSLLVKDLYFLNEGCSNKLPNGHINFEKFWQLAKQVTEFLTWKQVVCPFEKDPRVIAFLQASPILTENALALASFECEPPDSNHEKERYKALKAEHNT